MRRKISQLLALHSFNEVEQQFNRGMIGQQIFEAYCRVWAWIAPRFGGTPGFRQETFYNTFGKDRYYQRINKVRRAFNLAPL